MNEVLPIFGLVYFAVVVLAVGWTFYLMYLATLALRKYIRT